MEQNPTDKTEPSQPVFAFDSFFVLTFSTHYFFLTEEVATNSQSEEKKIRIWRN